MAITGRVNAMRKGSPWIQPVTVRGALWQPVETAGLEVADRDKLMATVRARVEALLEEG